MAANSSSNTLDFNASSKLTMLDCILDALKATNRTIVKVTRPPLCSYINAGNIADFRLNELPEGWVADIYFRDVPSGQPDAIGTPDAQPFATRAEAFLAGGELLTGSPELPFKIVGNQLILVGY